MSSTKAPPIDELKNSRKAVSIFGAGSYGRLALYALKKLDIPVAHVFDSDLKKWGSTFFGHPVANPELLGQVDKNLPIFISSNFITPIMEEVRQYGLRTVYGCVELLESVDFTNADVGMDIHEVRRRIFTHKNACQLLGKSKAEKLVIRMIDIEVTEKCTMKCKDCSNLMPYYTDPKNADRDLLLDTFSRLAAVVDQFNEVRVLGGEPFINKQLGAIVNFVAKFENVEKIAIFTNATIVPKNENLECLKNPKVFLDITNYGVHSKRHTELVAALEKNRIFYITHPPQIWTDSAKIQFFGRSDEENKKIFKTCCVNDIVTLLNGRLYRCPFSANAINLRAVPDFKGDYVDLTEQEMSGERLRSAVLDLYTNREFIGACSFCNGRDYTTPVVEPALQVKSPIPFQPIS